MEIILLQCRMNKNPLKHLPCNSVSLREFLEIKINDLHYGKTLASSFLSADFNKSRHQSFNLFDNKVLIVEFRQSLVILSVSISLFHLPVWCLLLVVLFLPTSYSTCTFAVGVCFRTSVVIFVIRNIVAAHLCDSCNH